MPTLLQIDFDIDEIACLIVQGTVGLRKPDELTHEQALQALAVVDAEAVAGTLRAAHLLMHYLIGKLGSGAPRHTLN